MAAKEQKKAHLIKIRLLKGLVFIMSLLIVVGAAVVVGTVAYRMLHGQSILKAGAEKQKSSGDSMAFEEENDDSGVALQVLKQARSVRQNKGQDGFVSHTITLPQGCQKLGVSWQARNVIVSLEGSGCPDAIVYDRQTSQIRSQWRFEEKAQAPPGKNQALNR